MKRIRFYLGGIGEFCCATHFGLGEPHKPRESTKDKNTVFYSFYQFHLIIPYIE